MKLLPANMHGYLTEVSFDAQRAIAYSRGAVPAHDMSVDQLILAQIIADEHLERRNFVRSPSLLEFEL